MAAVDMYNQTLVGLLEVGDQILAGTMAPDDFVTVVAVYERPHYRKMEVETFDHQSTIIRAPHTAVVLLAPRPLQPEDAEPATE